MGVRRERVAHGAGHPRLGQRDVHLLLGVPVSVEQEIADLHLLHEDLLEGVELVEGVLLLVRQRRGRSQQTAGAEHDEEQPHHRGCQSDQQTALRVHDHPSDGRQPPWWTRLVGVDPIGDTRAQDLVPVVACP